MTKPDLKNIPPFYQGYVGHVRELDVLEALRYSGQITQELIRSVSEEKGDYRYEPDKWSIKELVCHMMDTERIFAYRAMRFARHDKTPLAGFEENDYAPQANAQGRSIQQLANETGRLRATTMDLFSSLTPEMLQRTGTANNVELSVLSLGYIIAGHETHHRIVLLERYLKH